MVMSMTYAEEPNLVNLDNLHDDLVLLHDNLHPMTNHAAVHRAFGLNVEAHQLIGLDL